MKPCSVYETIERVKSEAPGVRANHLSLQYLQVRCNVHVATVYFPFIINYMTHFLGFSDCLYLRVKTTMNTIYEVI